MSNWTKALFDDGCSEKLKTRLSDQPPRDLQVFAYRCALRALPFLVSSQARKVDYGRVRYLFAVLIASAHTRSGAAFATDFPSAEQVAETCVACVGLSGLASNTAAEAAAAGAVAAAVPTHAKDAPAAIAAGVGGGSRAARSAADADFRELDRGVSGATLLQKPLWPDEPPAAFSRQLRHLEALMADTEQWGIWREWCRRKFGPTPLSAISPTVERAIAEAPFQVLERGPAAEMRRIVDAHGGWDGR